MIESVSGQRPRVYDSTFKMVFEGETAENSVIVGAKMKRRNFSSLANVERNPKHQVRTNKKRFFDKCKTLHQILSDQLHRQIISNPVDSLSVIELFIYTDLLHEVIN